MTLTDINIAIAEACGMDRRFVLMKRGLYYRPNANGYTSNVCEAWIVDEETAKRHVYPHDEPVYAKLAPLPNYHSDLNAMNSAEEYFDSQPADVRSLWLDTLAVCCKWPTVATALELKFEVSYLIARSTAPQRAEAFLRTIGKWTD